MRPPGWLLPFTILPLTFFPVVIVGQFFEEVPEELCTYEAPAYPKDGVPASRLYLDLLANVITGFDWHYLKKDRNRIEF